MLRFGDPGPDEVLRRVLLLAGHQDGWHERVAPAAITQLLESKHHLAAARASGRASGRAIRGLDRGAGGLPVVRSFSCLFSVFPFSFSVCFLFFVLPFCRARSLVFGCLVFVRLPVLSRVFCRAVFLFACWSYWLPDSVPVCTTQACLLEAFCSGVALAGKVPGEVPQCTP